MSKALEINIGKRKSFIFRNKSIVNIAKNNIENTKVLFNIFSINSRFNRQLTKNSNTNKNILD